MSELDRRDFLKVVGLSTGAAATIACDPPDKLVPYVIQPEAITPGIATDYASTCQECPVGCGLHVKTREGRPIKVEGNPDHPINRGALCARGQAGFSRAYHPDRIEGPMTRGSDGSAQPISWEDATAKVAAKLGGSAGKTWILGGPVGPSLTGVIDQFAAAAGLAGHLTYDNFGTQALVEASEQVFGASAAPIFDLSEADLVVDFGADFLDTTVELEAQWTKARDVNTHKDGGARLIAISPRQNLTASNADHWVAAAPGSEGVLALALAKAVARKKGASVAAVSGADIGGAVSAAGISQGVFDEMVEKLASASHAVALPPGVAASTSAGAGNAAAVLLLNSVLGAVGSQLTYPAEDAPKRASLADIIGLVEQMNAGNVDCLLIHDLNPVFSLPASIGFKEALSKVDLVVSFAQLIDETTEVAGLLMPDNAAVESWGDSSPRPGVRGIVQPTLRPLHDTRQLGDSILAIGRAMGGGVASQLPEGSFKSVLESNWSGSSWRQALARGGEFGATPKRTVSVAGSAGNVRPSAPKLAGSGSYTLVAFPHSYYGDGAGAALPWMQEIPDPVTKLSWNSWAEISQSKADELGVVFGDVISVETPSGSVELSVYPRGGIRDDVVAIPIGQGHTVGHYASHAGDASHEGATAKDAMQRGVNVADLLPAASDEAGGQAYLSTTANVAKTGRFRRLALSQWTDNQRGRGLAPEVSLYDLAKGGGMAHFAAAASAEGDHGEDGGDHGDGGGHHFEGPPFEFERGYDADPDQPYRWGMTIDNDKCTGCGACIAACYIENNVSIVGEEMAIKHREMTWLRIERYVGDGEVDFNDGAERRPTPDGEKLGENEVRHLPMLCQHCGAAPCEAVCPVIATYHTDEGINGMVYNRCVGTRYCGNNCTYKVRRFNYFDYGNKNWPGLLGLMLNPDVTVRGQGVMEKCSFCVQRIETARQPAKDEGRPIGDGEVLTACQQTCASQAITFGNVRDDQSAAVQLVKQSEDRAYHALQILNTRSAVTYLAQVRRDENGGH
ncbi:MAG: 4Fe-4S dicluster domain-containing protein [bacterium]|nr:4Fe-4S dicluster domain-containing protein [bacterium]